MAYPTQKARSGSSLAANTAHALSIPAHVTGDLILAIFSFAGATFPTIDEGISGSGWNVIATTPGPVGPNIMLFWKKAESDTEALELNFASATAAIVEVRVFNPNAEYVTATHWMSSTLYAGTNVRPARHTAPEDGQNLWLVAATFGGTVSPSKFPTNFTAENQTTVNSSSGAANHTRSLAVGRYVYPASQVVSGLQSLHPNPFTHTNALVRGFTIAITPSEEPPGASIGGGKRLLSKDTVEVLLGIAEGPIGGLVEGMKSFYIGDTPLQNQNGDMNFEDFTIDFHPGNPVASPVVMALGGISANRGVNVALETNVPVVRTGQLTNIDLIDVRIVVNRLVRNASSGPKPTKVEFSIEFKPSSASTWVKLYGENIVVDGLAMANWPKDFRFAVPRINDTYDVRVTKITAANTNKLFSDITFESFQEIIAEEKAYNDTALIHAVGKASDQFSSLPQFAGDYYGKICAVPINYDPVTREYDGIWNGAWKFEWTDNPAWVLYDYVMNDRYGMRAHYPDIVLDKYDVYEAAQWCDELVPDGRGGFQPRYTFNAYLTEPQNGRQLARYIAGVFNATFADDLNGTAFLRVDKDDPAVYTFTQENVINGDFEYSYTDLTSRYNDVTVKFMNPNLNWNEDVRRVYSPSYIDRYGRIPLEFVAVGCIDPHEAVRRAQYKLITANTETRIVRFVTNRVGLFLRVFDPILICDPDMGWGVSGRVKTLNEARTTISLRDPVYIEAGISYDIYITLNDGTEHQSTLSYLTEGERFTLQFEDAVPEGKMEDFAVFRLEQTGAIGAPRPFRIVKIDEVDGQPDQIAIEAININRNKWYDSDNIADSGEIVYTALPNPFNVPGPENVGFEELFVTDTVQFNLTITPYFNRRVYPYFNDAGTFEVWSRLAGTDDPYQMQTLVSGNILVNHPPGLFDFKILGISSLGTKTLLDAAPVWQFNVTNPYDPPADIPWVKQNRQEIYWVYPDPPVDFDGFVVRYHNTLKFSWQDAIQPHNGVLSATQFYTNLIPQSARVIMVKAIDRFGVVSQNAATLIRDENVLAVATNQVERFEFHSTSPPWQGDLIGCSLDEDDGFLKADPTGTFYSGIPTAPMYTGDPDALIYQAVYDEFIYISSFTVTHPGDLLFNVVYQASGYEISLREAGSPPGPWFLAADRPSIEVGSYDVQIRLFGGPVRGILEEFTIIVDAEDEYEYVVDVEIDTAGSRLPIQKTYSEIKVVSITILDDGGDAVSSKVFDLQNIVGDGPLVKLYDKDGGLTSGRVTAHVRGYV